MKIILKQMIKSGKTLQEHFFGHGKMGDFESWIGPILIDPSSYKLYTQKKDINGKMVFEGDKVFAGYIAHNDHFVHWVNHAGEVFFDEKTLSFRIKFVFEHSETSEPLCELDVLIEE